MQMSRANEFPDPAAIAAYDQQHAAAVDALSSADSYLVVVEHEGETLVAADSNRIPLQLFLARAAKAAAAVSSDCTSDLFAAVDEYLAGASESDSGDPDDSEDADTSEEREE
jgi:hypothetical protein